MEKKKKLIISASAVAGTMVLGSAFALFSDKIVDNTTGKVGTVDIEASTNLTHTQINREWLAEALSISERDFHDEAGPSLERDLPYLPYLSVFHKIALHDGFLEFDPYNGFVPVLNAEGTSFGDFKDLASIMEPGKDNLNPGDNDFTFTTDDINNVVDYKPGTDHEITINVENKGTKSVRTRLKIYATATDRNGAVIPAEDIMQQLQIGLDFMNSKAGVTSIHPFDILCMPLERGISEKNKDTEVIYELSSLSDYSNQLLEQMSMIPDNDPVHGEALSKFRDPLSDYIRSGLVLSGVGEEGEAEIETFTKKTGNFRPLDGTLSLEDLEKPNQSQNITEEIVNAPSSGSFKIDVGLANLNTNDASLANIEVFEGGTVNLRIEVEAMQYRNTSDQSWTPVISDEIVMNIE